MSLIIEPLETLDQILKANLVALRGKESQFAFAERAKVPYRTYQDAENGRIPRDKALDLIAKAHGIPKMALFMDPDLRGFSFVKPPTIDQALDTLVEFVRKTQADSVIQTTPTTLADTLAAALEDDEFQKTALFLERLTEGRVRLVPLPKRAKVPHKT